MEDNFSLLRFQTDDVKTDLRRNGLIPIEFLPKTSQLEIETKQEKFNILISELCKNFDDFLSKESEDQYIIIENLVFDYFPPIEPEIIFNSLHNKNDNNNYDSNINISQVILRFHSSELASFINLIFSNMFSFEELVKPIILRLLTNIAQMYLLFLDTECIPTFFDVMNKLFSENYKARRIDACLQLIAALASRSKETAILMFPFFPVIMSLLSPSNLRILTLGRELCDSLLRTIYIFIKQLAFDRYYQDVDECTNEVFDIKIIFKSISSLIIENEDGYKDNFFSPMAAAYCLEIVAQFVKVNQDGTAELIISNQLLEFSISMLQYRLISCYYPILKIINYGYRNGIEYDELLIPLIQSISFSEIFKFDVIKLKKCCAKFLTKIFSRSNTSSSPECKNALLDKIYNENNLISILIDGLAHQPGVIVSSYSELIFRFLTNCPVSKAIEIDIMKFIKQSLDIVQKNDPDIILFVVQSLKLLLDNLIITQNHELIGNFINTFNIENGEIVINECIEDSFDDSSKTNILKHASDLYVIIAGYSS